MSPQTARNQDRVRALTGAFLVIMAGLLVLMLGVVVFLAFQDHQRIRQNQAIQQFIKDQAIRNGNLSRDVRRSTNLIESCTTPGGDCYNRSNQQTGKAISDINRITIYAAACADRPGDQTLAEIQSCVFDRIAKAER